MYIIATLHYELSRNICFQQAVDIRVKVVGKNVYIPKLLNEEKIILCFCMSYVVRYVVFCAVPTYAIFMCKIPQSRKLTQYQPYLFKLFWRKKTD